MKKKKILILIDSILYIIFSILYSSKGFALMLAEETARAHVVYNKYGKSYSYLNFKPISIILYRVGALGLILTGIISIVLVTRVTYAEIKKGMRTFKILIYESVQSVIKMLIFCHACYTMKLVI